ncbi:DUF1439 domain-containing protein [Herbaspirillum robiniae]|uniref:DUF1439 domain-containing protein n=1 Tax=Herbaspirillum robiniae TaxID=2014887 RepID=A0A246WUP2_9BURK|nr:DUF1439 domain-containing protein [Herbaspirillum robiniae]NUT99999.1 DUF1439 domain-containing protein [Herbaspirillum robiniae]OWY30763.1 DUF1439 domain-containing protein [Herbaspirillum robiniae]
MNQAKTLACAALLALGLAQAAHAAYNVWTNEYSVSRQELETAIAPQFPRKLRYMDIFDVTLSNPRLGMDAANNRLTTVVDAQIANPLLLAKPVNAALTMSSGFRYDAASRSLRLDAPKVDNVDSQDLPPQYARQLTALGNATADQLLRDYAVYTFKPEQLEMNGKRFEPGKITVEKDAVKVEIKEQ